ncbi:protein SODIUM POTASSIUM ROOT DEFECTIVE 1-like [Nymphaea colorata]|nr:protein SODIUM POTASSIUM ROOT DEFECTIVE 1-like [Nymphaea colorata]
MSTKGMKTTKMADFFCRSPSATAVCLATDRRSVINPSRLIDHAKLLDVKYSRLMDPRPVDVQGRQLAIKPTLPPPPVPQLRRSKSERSHRQRQLAYPPPAKRSEVPALRPTSDARFHVVVMRVSLHCQGCAGKVKKHISKMEGVTSFSIDLETKRVTVMGHVSPLGVLESISKVKKAEFWHSEDSTVAP